MSWGNSPKVGSKGGGKGKSGRAGAHPVLHGFLFGDKPEGGDEVVPGLVLRLGGCVESYHSKIYFSETLPFAARNKRFFQVGPRSKRFFQVGTRNKSNCSKNSIWRARMTVRWRR